MIFDTHAHYDDDRFNEDRDELIASFPENGIGAVCNVSSDIESVRATVSLVEKHDFFYGAVGIHPSDCGELTEELLGSVMEFTSMDRIVAVGEIGLDYYWDTPDRSIQKKWFSRQLDLAAGRDLPVIIHSRDAAADTYDMMCSCGARDIGGVVHCYAYDKDWVRKFLDLGFFIGIGGRVTFKNASDLREVAEFVPLDRIVLETDCPYLAPDPFRGKRNSSLYLKYVVSKLAEIRGISEEEVESATWENAKRLYKLFDKVRFDE